MLSRNLGLDLLRGVAVLLVLLRHLEPCTSNELPLWTSFVSIVRQGGWIGVDLFFVLSGYLVSGLLFNEWLTNRSLRVGRFLIRRGFKIYPSLWLLLLVTVALRFISKGIWDLPKLAAEILFVQNYFPGLWPHTWSLAVEEHFYIGLAAVAGLLGYSAKTAGTSPFQRVPKLCLILGAACLTARILTAFEIPHFDQRTHFYPTHLRLDSLGFGVLLSWARAFGSSRLQQQIQRGARLLLPVSLLVLSWPFIWPAEQDWWMLTFGFTLIYLAAGAWVWLCVTWNLPKGNALVWTVCRIGFHSYSIYLWHFPVQWWLLEPLKKRLVDSSSNHMLLSGLYIVGSVIVGVVVAKCLEVPVLKLRDHWFPAATRLLPQQQQSQLLRSSLTQTIPPTDKCTRPDAGGKVEQG